MQDLQNVHSLKPVKKIWFCLKIVFDARSIECPQSLKPVKKFWFCLKIVFDARSTECPQSLKPVNNFWFCLRTPINNAFTTRTNVFYAYMVTAPRQAEVNLHTPQLEKC
jgi:hypothetical protein